MRPEDGVLVAALAVTHTPEELWALAQAIARAAVIREQEADEPRSGDTR